MYIHVKELENSLASSVVEAQDMTWSRGGTFEEGQGGAL